MNISTAFPSKFLKAAELDEDTTYTIKAVQQETVGQGADADEKPVVYFTEAEQGLVLNKTNANTIASLYGYETDGWVGKQVTLFATEVEYQGKMSLAIRIRTRKPMQLPARPTKAPVSNPLEQDPLTASKTAAYRSFLNRWNDFEAEHPDEAGEKQGRWKLAQEHFFSATNKTIASATADDWKALAQKVESHFDPSSGDFLPF